MRWGAHGHGAALQCQPSGMARRESARARRRVFAELEHYAGETQRHTMSSHSVGVAFLVATTVPHRVLVRSVSPKSLTRATTWATLARRLGRRRSTAQRAAADAAVPRLESGKMSRWARILDQPRGQISIIWHSARPATATPTDLQKGRRDTRWKARRAANVRRSPTLNQKLN